MVLYGASPDSLEANRTFAAGNGYRFVLLCDTEKQLARALGVLGWFGLANRWTFIIDDRGVIRSIDKDVHTRTAGVDLVRKLEALGAPRRSSPSPSRTP